MVPLQGLRPGLAALGADKLAWIFLFEYNDQLHVGLCFSLSNMPDGLGVWFLIL